SDGSEVSPSEIREHLQETVPAYLVPSAFIFLDALPITPNGKVDYRSLPDPDSLSASTYEPPQGEVELKLARLWEETLEHQPIGRVDHFCYHGGHSCKCLRLFTRIQKEFGHPPPLSTLSHAPTVAQLATHLTPQDQASLHGHNGHQSAEVVSPLSPQSARK